MSEPKAADPAFEPISTERLLIRAPLMDDLPAIIARRNDPEVAKYQDWTVPHPPERSQERLEAAIAQGGLVDGEWWSAAVTRRDTGQPIGDLAIKIAWSWRATEIGYSFDSAEWGNGYATEALEAMLSHLFDDRGIQRAFASLHPDNIASAMLLERLGFTYEGQTKQSFWEGEGPDAEISDDMFYGLTKADRDLWNGRATGPPSEVKLIDVDHENQRAVGKLVTHKSQERLVAPVIYSYANALFPEHEEGHPVLPRMWAIEADDELAGFVMIADMTEHHADPYLWRLLIDRRFQRRGIGGRAVDLIEDYCRSRGATKLYVSWDQGPGSPEPFYLARGYELTGETYDDEVEGCKPL